MSALDLFPTFCAIAKAPLPAGFKPDGEEMSRVFYGQSLPRSQPLFWEYGRNAAFGYPKGRDRSPNLAVRDRNWKLLTNSDGTGAELYDLAADKNENQNVSTEHPDITTRLSEQVIDWRKRMP
jgi:arylsulfatase A-like enzyme